MSDPLFPLVSVLMHFDENLDEVKGASPYTSQGTTTYETADPKLGSGSRLYNLGSTDAIDFNYNGERPLPVSGGFDFTFEYWIKVPAIPTETKYHFAQYISSNVNRFNLSVNATTGTPRWWNIATGTINGNTNICDDEWHFMAYVYDDTESTMKIYVDGVQDNVGDEAVTINGFTNTPLSINGLATTGGQGDTDGLQLDELRITLAQRYKGNFSPPSLPFPDEWRGDPYFAETVSLNHYDTDILTDVIPTADPWTFSDTAGTATLTYSTDQSRWETAGSMLGTDGASGTEVAMIYRTALLDYTLPFTFEVSIFPTSLATINGIFYQGGSSYQDDSNRFQLNLRTDGDINIFASTGGTAHLNYTTSGLNLPTGVWTDIALTFDGVDTLTLFINGAPVGSTTGFSDYVQYAANDLTRWGFGRSGGDVQMFTGYLDETRITQVDRYGGLAYDPAPFPDDAEAVTGSSIFMRGPLGPINMQVSRGYGGVERVVPTTPAVTITAGTWYTIPTDTAMLDNPLNLVQDEINAGISALTPGVWRVDVSLSCGFDPISSKARYAYLRLFNITQGAPFGTKTTSITIEKNIEAFNISTSGLFEVPTVSDDLLGLQLGGSSDDLLGFTVDGYKLMATLVAEL